MKEETKAYESGKLFKNYIDPCYVRRLNMFDLKKWKSTPDWLEWHLNVWFKENKFKFGKNQRLMARNLFFNVFFKTEPELLTNPIERAFLELYEEHNGINFSEDELQTRAEQYYRAYGNSPEKIFKIF